MEAAPMTARPTSLGHALLALVTLLCARACYAPAYASDRDPIGLPLGSTCMRPGGAVLPCHGVLISPARARELATAETDRDELQAALDSARELRAIDAREAAETLAASEAARRACEETRAPPPRRTPWYERPGWVLAGGVVLGAGLVAGVVALAH
jgi:hypothetical protein